MSKSTKKINIGEEIWKWAKKLLIIIEVLQERHFDTLKFIKLINEDIKIKFASSRTKVFDWIIPDEWEVKEVILKIEKK